MKFLKNILGFVLVISLFAACKKDDDDTSTAVTSADVAGNYVGKFGTGSNEPSSYFAFNIRANGEIDEVNSSGEVVGTGIWSLVNGNVVKATWYYPSPSTSSYSMTSIYDPAQKKLTGTWGFGNNEIDGGKYYMTK